MSDDPTDAGPARTSGAVALRSGDDGQAIVQAVIAGETWAERELFERYSPMVHNTLRRCLGPLPDLDDLMQEVFLRIFGRVRTLRDVGALRSFIYSITIRVARTHLRTRRARRYSDAVQGADLDNVEAVSADPEARDLLARVQRILDGMKPKHRIAFVLRHLDDQPVCDVARELEVSVATVNRWLTRATRHIEKEIGRDERLAGLLDREGTVR